MLSTLPNRDPGPSQLPDAHKSAAEAHSRGEHEEWRHKLAIKSNSMLLRLPHYLYRAESEQSQGYNLQGLYQSRSIRLGAGEANFFSYSKDAMRDELRAHVQNRSQSGHWISFTDSINVAIRFALTMKERSAKKIRIHIIDTTQLLKPALIVHSHTMLQLYDVELSRNLCYDRARTETS
jgi:hypothetical protein